MKDQPTLARRDLLRGAAALAGGSMLGILPSLAEASALPAKPVALSLGFWNGARFAAAESMRWGDASLDRVRLTLTSVGETGVATLQAHAPHPELGLVPFLVWVAPPAGPERWEANVIADAQGGLTLAATTVDGSRHELRLTTERSASAKLREGTYLLTAGRADWNAYGIDSEGQVQTMGERPHLRIDVARL